MGKKATYGAGHPIFQKYMLEIVEHPVYAGMPDVYKEDGQIQWETPSNRQGGKFQHSHQRRLEWWMAKAKSIGIDPDTTPRWISEVAKRIHPFRRRPCKECGLVLDLRYVYPKELLVKRLLKLEYVKSAGFEFKRWEPIQHVVERLHSQFGDRIFRDMPDALKAKGLSIPKLANDLAVWIRWLDETYVPAEPSMLSPGDWANPPDRLDGFHSLNNCCRAKTDTGRHKENLRSYSTDRRAFEFWVEGNWIAADRLMGQIKADEAIRAHRCMNGHEGPCDADHIGPISLGFCHRPEFLLLCSPCNSAKNNRLTLSDVNYLRQRTDEGEQVASWYCEHLWNLLSERVRTRELATRLTKVMRDNRHTGSYLIGAVIQAGHFRFLLSLLGLNHALHEIKFDSVEVTNYNVRFRGMRQVPRRNSFVREQQARRVRIAFSSLEQYLDKANRNAELVETEASQRHLSQALNLLSARKSSEESDFDERLRAALDAENDVSIRAIIEAVLADHPEPSHFTEVRGLLRAAMDSIAEELAGRWDGLRYSRAEIADEAATDPED